MIGYVTLCASEFEKTAHFYDEILGELNAKRFTQTDDYIAWHVAPGQPGVSIIKPKEENSSIQNQGMMVSLLAQDKSTVDIIHQKAMALGGLDEGRTTPKESSCGVYGVYFKDIEGNRLSVFCRSDEDTSL